MERGDTSVGIWGVIYVGIVVGIDKFVVLDLLGGGLQVSCWMQTWRHDLKARCGIDG